MTESGSPYQARPDRPPTIRDVARLAGTSKSAAARVLSGRGYASVGLRTLVLAAAETLAYTPNAIGKSFRQQTTATIGLIVPDITNAFYPFVADGVMQVMRERDYRVVLVASDESDATELKCLNLLMESRVDGIIAVPTGGNLEAWAKAIRIGRRLVLIDRPVPGLAGAGLVCVDNRGGARKAVEHLIGLGHRRIGLLAGPMAVSTARERFEGYAAAHAGAGLGLLPELVVETSYTRQYALEAALSLLDRPAPPTAVLAANNILGEAVVAAARQLRRAVPGELSIVVFDDPPWAALLDPPATAVAQPMREIGTVAAERMLALLGDSAERAAAALEPAVLPTELIVRGSTAAPGAGSPE